MDKFFQIAHQNVPVSTNLIDSLLKKVLKIDDPLPLLSERIRKDFLTDRGDVLYRDRYQFISVIKFKSGIRKLILTFIIISLSVPGVVAPNSGAVTIIKTMPVNPYSKLMYATAQVETMGNIFAYNEIENAVGILQIRQVRIDDYNRRTGSNFKLKDMFDPGLSEKVFMYYSSLYAPRDLEKIAKAWNGSGPMTELYWKRIKEYL